MKLIKALLPIVLSLSFLGGCSSLSKESESSVVESNETKTYHTVTFDSNGGTAIEPQLVLHGEKVKKPYDPIKTGYTFDKWMHNNEPWSFVGYVVTSDITLLANYTPNSYQLVVNNSNTTAGYVTGSGMYAYGSSVTIEAFPNSGYDFDGWYGIDDGLVSRNKTYTFTMQLSLTLYAKWKYAKYSIVINSNNNTYGSVEILSGTGLAFEQITVKGTPKEGYELQRIQDRSGNIVAFKDYGSLDEGVMRLLKPDNWDNIYIYTRTAGYVDTEEYAPFPGVKLTPKIHSSIYELDIRELMYNYGFNYTSTDFVLSNGLSGENNQTREYYFDQFLYSTNRSDYFKIKNQELVGHNVEKIQNDTYSFTMQTSAASFVFYFAPIAYQISYELNGGGFDNVNACPLFYFTTNRTILPSPIRTGYSFISWTNTNNQTVYKIDIGEKGDRTFIANWNDGNVYRVTIDPDGGEIDSIYYDVQYDHPYQIPTPYKRGYSVSLFDILDQYQYVGHSFVSASGEHWEIDKDINVRPIWDIIFYKINLYESEDVLYKTIEYTVNSEDIELPEYSPQNKYTFAGWYTKDGEKVERIEQGSIGDIDLYLELNDRLYEIVVASEDEEKGSAEWVSGVPYYQNEITVKATPNEGYIFEGWYCMYADAITTPYKVSNEETFTFKMPDSWATFKIEARFLTPSEYEEKQLKIKKDNGEIPYLVWNSSYGTTVVYGLFPYLPSPGNLIKDQLDEYLENNVEPEESGYYKCVDNYYYRFKDSWYSCQHIYWGGNVNFDYSIGEYKLYSLYIIDAGAFHNSEQDRTIDDVIIYPNNYQYSDIRAYLNGEFFNMAFHLNNEYLLPQVGYNNSDYVCLPSSSDKVNAFSTPEWFAREKGVPYFNAHQYSQVLPAKYGTILWTMDAAPGKRKEVYSFYASWINSDGGDATRLYSDYVTRVCSIKPVIYLKYKFEKQ